MVTSYFIVLTTKWDGSQPSTVGLKLIYAALFTLTMEQPFYKVNALLKSVLISTEIEYFEW